MDGIWGIDQARNQRLPIIWPQLLSNENHIAPMLLMTTHKGSLMEMKATLANPLLIAIYSAALLLIGCGVGIHWAHTPATALRLAIAGGVLMVVHDMATGILWFWLAARCARSEMQRNNHR
jgi:hypothetical protein